MYAETIDAQLSRITRDLEHKGLTYDQLQEDLIDHICCMVEESMEAGKDFETSYGKVMSSIEEHRFRDIQQETLILLDTKFQKMKKLTYALGFTGSLLAITGSIFKTMHWPGANILLSLGFLIVVLGFLPLYFISGYKEQAEKPPVIFPLVAYFTLFIVFTGALFKVMHWPGAGILLKASTIFILVGFLPLYIVQIFKKAGGAKVNMAYVIMLLVGLSIVLILSRVNISKDAVDRFTEVSLQYENSIDLLEKRNAYLLANDSLGVQGEEVKTYVTELTDLADVMLNALLAGVDQEGESIENVKGRDARNVARDAFMDNGEAQKFKVLTREFQEYILDHFNDPLVLSQVEINLLFSSDLWHVGWTYEDFAYDPLIINYYKITSFKYEILATENLILEKLAK